MNRHYERHYEQTLITRIPISTFFKKTLSMTAFMEREPRPIVKDRICSLFKKECDKWLIGQIYSSISQPKRSLMSR